MNNNKIVFVQTASPWIPEAKFKSDYCARRQERALAWHRMHWANVPFSMVFIVSIVVGLRPRTLAPKAESDYKAGQEWVKGQDHGPTSLPDSQLAVTHWSLLLYAPAPAEL